MWVAQSERLATEDSVENHLRKLVKTMRGLCIKLNPFGVRGIPDRIVLLPGGIVLFYELKRPVGGSYEPVSYTHLTLPTTLHECRSRWSPDH